MKKNNPVPLQTNLISQNCFIRDIAPVVDLKTDYPEEFYESMEEVVDTDNPSLSHVRKVYPYEITPEYVNSFAESSDFRKDPVSAIVNAPQGRQNLSDIRDYQKVSDMDDTSARNLFEELKQRFQKTELPKTEPPKTDPPKTE